MIKKVLLALIMALIIGAGAILVWMQRTELRKTEAKKQELQQIMIPLQQEKRAMLDEMSRLQKQVDGKKLETATLELLFSSLNERLYLEVFPIMLQYGMKGVMVLSEENVPGMPGKITIRQFEEMIHDGWSYCILWDGTSTVWELFQKVQWKMPENTLDVPDTVYLEKGTYTAEMDQNLISQGIRAVVHHGETGLPVDITGVDQSLWHIGAVEWSQENARSWLGSNQETRSNLVFDIRLEDQTEIFGIQDLLYAITTYQKNQVLEVVDFSDLKRLFAYNPENYRWVRIDDLKQQMSELQKKMNLTDEKLRALRQGKNPDDIVIPDQTEASVKKDTMTLRTEIDRFEKDHPEQIIGAGTVELLFLDGDESIYREVFPRLHALSIKAVLGISPGAPPGSQGQLSWDEIRAMLDDGWECCLLWSGQKSIAEELGEYRHMLSMQQIEDPGMVWVPSGSFTESVRNDCFTEGVRVVVHHGELGQPVSGYISNPEFWEAGSMDWTDRSGELRLDTLAENAYNLIISIHTASMEHPYLETGLEKLMENSEELIKSGRLVFTNCSEGKKLQMEAEKAREAANREREEGLSRLYEQLGQEYK